MSKKSREAIKDNLARALAPPTRKRGGSLDELLDVYSPPDETRTDIKPVDSGPPALSGPLNERPPALPMSGPTSVSGPTVTSGPTTASDPEQYDLKAILPQTAGHTEVPHKYSDHLCAALSPDEQAVYFQLYRLSWGWNKETCFISIPRLSERSSVPESTLRRVLKKLEGKKLVERTERKFGGGKTEQGITFRVFALSGPPALSGPVTASGPTAMTPNKEEVKKANKAAASLEITKCPDCQGSGFYYPEGIEKGVARCKHENLKGM